MENTFRNTKRYMQNYAELYGDGKPAAKRIIKKSAVPTEMSEQIRYVRWLKDNHILFFHIPNGSNKTLSQRIAFKAMGLIAGVPDVFVCHPSQCSAHDGKPLLGLFVELKRVSGSVTSQEQKDFMAKLNEKGYLAVVARGATMAIEITKEYLGML
jgi:hypothetical protein